ncbi:hypothetical protein C4K22_4180 [Pseudomonas chlororaphis subsp. aurantiaca]|nr:hypothetical protein C4K22_4180 [Pseudomonas chlororaphis subsp. aurantiaca]AZD93689.1 hypothetical protein C4K13_4280 [Pseudomonas chlororaphis subsp. aureofaciens]SDS45789.1 hypothetical protein SAMN04489803_1459 [Pseudomonas chlororaphis]AZD43254.1 hypothetical protein C4K21_4188 [Pseudomonas chlororaphis subsp. aurantiaca]AZD49497.1 hypothetical protein C4K20_4090 [Pseudomonas chlororaphis subsp. aurantiaca]
MECGRFNTGLFPHVKRYPDWRGHSGSLYVYGYKTLYHVSRMCYPNIKESTHVSFG